MATQNYSEGVFKPAFGGNHAYDYSVMGGKRYGEVDWDDLASVQKFSGIAKRLWGQKKAQLEQIPLQNTGDRLISSGNIVDPVAGIGNPYYSQGLGPENYKGMYESDQVGDQARWFEASYNKFELRAQELKGIAAAGGPEQFAAQQTAREALSKPFAEGARSAELLRQDRGPRVGGGAPQGGAGRQANRARAAEGRRLTSSDRTTGSGGGGGGGTANRRLRAANLLRQPLGAGSQSAAQLLG